MRSDKIVNAYDSVRPGGEVRDRVFGEAMRKKGRYDSKRRILKITLSLASAAAIITCAAVLGKLFPFPPGGTFTQNSDKQGSSVFAGVPDASDVSDASQDAVTVVTTDAVTVDTTDAVTVDTTGDASADTTTAYPAVTVEFAGETASDDVSADASAEWQIEDLINQNETGYYRNAEYTYYFGFRVDCGDADIERVELAAVEEGMLFATQHVKREDGMVVYKDIAGIFLGPDNTPAMYGLDFDVAGDSLFLNRDEITEDLLTFVIVAGSRRTTPPPQRQGDANMSTAPDEIPIRAVVTYRGGETQEREFVLDIKNHRGAGRVAQSPEELELSRKWHVEKMESYDTEKIADAFVLEAKKHGFSEVSVKTAEYINNDTDSYSRMWRVTYDAMPEDSAEWLLDQTRDVRIGFVGGNSGTPETGWVDEDTYIVYWESPLTE